MKNTFHLLYLKANNLSTNGNDSFCTSLLSTDGRAQSNKQKMMKIFLKQTINTFLTYFNFIQFSKITFCSVKFFSVLNCNFFLNLDTLFGYKKYKLSSFNEVLFPRNIQTYKCLTFNWKKSI